MRFKLWLESLKSQKLRDLQDYLYKHSIESWPTEKVIQYLAKWPGTIEIYEDNIDDESISKFPLVIGQDRWGQDFVPLDQNKENLARIWDYVKSSTYIREFMQYFLEHFTSAYDEATDSKYYFKFLKELPSGTWVVHRTDKEKAEQIKKFGFQIGVSDFRKLGTTVHISSDDPLKSGGGYNFGYLSGSYNLKRGSYGDGILMFRTEGLLVYHAQDDDEQVIFDGKAIDASKIVLIEKENNDYVVKSQNDKDPDPFRDQDLLKVTRWVRENFSKSKEIIT